MSTATAQQAYVSAGPFAHLGKGWKVGTLLTKVWKAPYTRGVTPIWAERTEGYWRRMEQKFGIIVTDQKNAWDVDPIAGPVVATYAAILLILPGERMFIPEGHVFGN